MTILRGAALSSSSTGLGQRSTTAASLRSTAIEHIRQRRAASPVDALDASREGKLPLRVVPALPREQREYVRQKIKCKIAQNTRFRTLDDAIVLFKHPVPSTLEDRDILRLVRRELRITKSDMSPDVVTGLCALLDPGCTGRVQLSDLREFLNTSTVPENGSEALVISQQRSPKELWNVPDSRTRSLSPSVILSVRSRRASGCDLDDGATEEQDACSLDVAQRFHTVRRDAMERERKRVARTRLKLALTNFHQTDVRRFLDKAAEESALIDGAGDTAAVDKENVVDGVCEGKQSPKRIGRELPLKDLFERAETYMSLQIHINCLQDAIDLGREAGLGDQALAEPCRQLEEARQAWVLVRGPEVRRQSASSRRSPSPPRIMPRCGAAPPPRTGGRSPTRAASPFVFSRPTRSRSAGNHWPTRAWS